MLHEVVIGPLPSETATAMQAPKPYTASIDAALSLVDPEHWAISEFQIWKGCPAALRILPVKLDTIRTANAGDQTAYWSRGYGIKAEAPTPALALCIAALRARAAQKGDE